MKQVVDRLTKLPIIAVTTHVHWDYIGGHRCFDHIAVYETEKDWLLRKFPLPLQAVKHNLTKQPCNFPSDFNIDNYQIFHGMPQIILHDKDCLDLGGRELFVIHIPGHCCFMNKREGICIRETLYIKAVLTHFILPLTHSYFINR